MPIYDGPRASSRRKRAHLAGARSIASMFVLGFRGVARSKQGTNALGFLVALDHECPSFGRKVVVDAYDDDHRGIALRSWLGSSDDQRHMCLLEGARGKST